MNKWTIIGLALGSAFVLAQISTQNTPTHTESGLTSHEITNLVNEFEHTNTESLKSFMENNTNDSLLDSPPNDLDVRMYEMGSTFHQ